MGIGDGVGSGAYLLLEGELVTWTAFWDKHSGGGCKEPPYEYIYIEAPEKPARKYFKRRFGHKATRVTCNCCGQDYSISEEPSLEQATGYERGASHNGKKWVGGKPLETFRKRGDVLIISAAEMGETD